MPDGISTGPNPGIRTLTTNPTGPVGGDYSYIDTITSTDRPANPAAEISSPTEKPESTVPSDGTGQSEKKNLIFHDKLFRVDDVKPLGHDFMSGLSVKLLEAERRWNFHALKMQGKIKPGDSQTQIDEQLKSVSTVDQQKVEDKMLKMQFATGRFFHKNSHEPFNILGLYTTGYPNRVFISTAYGKDQIRIALVHELMHSFQHFAKVKVRRGTAPNYKFKQTYLDGIHLFKDLNKEMQASYVGYYATGRFKPPEAKPF